MRGRGAAENPPDRFSELAFVPDPEPRCGEGGEGGEDGTDGAAGEARPAPATRLYRDSSRSILARNESPDLPFSFSLNPYRGCEHGCIYCYARPTHEWLGWSAGLDFETRLLVKEEAPNLLRQELSHPKWEAQVISLSGNTDCYQPIEKKLGITRRCLEVLAEFRNPVGVITKSGLVTRDIDVLQQLAQHGAAMVLVTITTLDDELAAALEPRAARPAKRLATIGALAAAGIPTGVMVAPVIPGLTDHEIPAILAAAAREGARIAGWQLLRLPYGVKELFESWLARWRPDRREKVLHRIRDLHGGRINESRFGVRMRGEGEFARQLEQLFRLGVVRAGLSTDRFRLNASAFRRPGPRQGGLFGG